MSTSPVVVARPGPRIDLLRTQGCPHVDGARSLLRACLTELGLSTPIREREGSYPSPTILVDGADVMGRSDVTGAMCRLDLPTHDRIVAALTEVS